MKNQALLIDNLTKIFGYGYTNIFSVVNNIITEHNMSATQIKIIEYIFVETHASPTELADMLDVNKSAVTQVLKKLEQKELITVKENTFTDDKRSKLIYLTDDAKKILIHLTTEIRKEIEKSLNQLNKNELSELSVASDVIVKLIIGGTINEKNITI